MEDKGKSNVVVRRLVEDEAESDMTAKVVQQLPMDL